MAAFLPIPGGHITFAERFVDPAWSFALGWLYCESREPTFAEGTLTPVLLGYNWTIVLPAELSAASVLIGYW